MAVCVSHTQGQITYGALRPDLQGMINGIGDVPESIDIAVARECGSKAVGVRATGRYSKVDCCLASNRRATRSLCVRRYTGNGIERSTTIGRDGLAGQRLAYSFTKPVGVCGRRH